MAEQAFVKPHILMHCVAGMSRGKGEGQGHGRVRAAGFAPILLKLPPEETSVRGKSQHMGVAGLGQAPGGLLWGEKKKKIIFSAKNQRGVGVRRKVKTNLNSRGSLTFRNTVGCICFVFFFLLYKRETNLIPLVVKHKIRWD